MWCWRLSEPITLLFTLVAIPCNFIAKRLHFYCMKCCLLITAELRFCLVTVAAVSRFYLASISPLSRFYPSFIEILQLYWNKSAIPRHIRCNQSATMLLHLSCGLIAFQLHFDCMKLLHFDCVSIVALHYNCIIITLRLHYYCMTFGLHFDYTTIAMMPLNYNRIAIKTQCKILLHLSCSLIAFQLHFDCMKFLHFDCIFVALHPDCKNITFRLHYYYMTFGLHFDYTTIEILQLYCNKSEIKVQSISSQSICNPTTFRV
jgi:hypothetical protein